MTTVDNKSNIRSKCSVVRSYVRFHNNTRRKLEIFWIDFKGNPVLYANLDNGEFIDINTYVSHPWIFLDYITKERYLVNKEHIYMPKPTSLEQSPRTIPNMQFTRDFVYIIQPLYTLRELCIRMIKDHLRHDKDAFQLQLPKILQHEIANAPPRKV